MRLVWLVLLLATLTLAGCSGATPTALPPTQPPAATLTPVPTQAPPTATFAPPTSTATAQASATAVATEGGPTPTTGPTATATLDPAVAVIYAYLVARAKADVQGVTELTCDAFDGQAATEAVSFRSMNATLNDDLECQLDGADGPYSLVACTGTKTTTYGPEARVWDLSNSIYQATVENGAWTMCGYH
jgi:hypothetical protein